MTPDRKLEWDWFSGTVPENVVLGDEAYLETTYSFQLFRSIAPEAVRLGRGSSIYLGVMFDLGPDARLHLYGKTEARPGRKMGHINRLRPRTPGIV